MANNNETTTRFRVDISELKKGMQEASRQIRLANSEFKAATAGMDKWSDSADGITAKITQLNKTLDAQKSQLDNLKRQYEITVAEQGETSRGAQELLIRINNQKAAIKETEKQIQSYNTKLEEMTSSSEDAADEQDQVKTAMDRLKDTISDQESELEDLKNQYSNFVLEQDESSDAAQDLARQIDELSSELNNNRNKLSEAEDAADDFDNTLDDLDESSDETSGGFTVLTGALANLVSQGIQLAISAVKDFIKESIEVGKTFDSSMSNVAALSGATAEELQLLRDTAKEYGSTTKYSATEAADALSYMALAGWDANQSASALGGVLDLAASANMDLAKASDMVTDYMSAFNMEADKSAYFADILAYAQSHANTTAEGLGEAFKNCAANLNAGGQDIETVTSLLSMMANQGYKGSVAGTGLSAVMRDMTNAMIPIKDEADLARLGLEGMTDMIGQNVIAIGDNIITVSDAEGNYRNLIDILFEVEDAIGSMGEAERAIALSSSFTSDSIKSLNLILNAGVQQAADFEWQLRSSSVTLNGFETAANEAGIPIDEFKQRLEEAGISSDDFAQALGDTGGYAETFADELNEWTKKGYDVYDIMDDLGISLDDLQNAMDNSTGSAAEMAKVMQDNLGGDLTNLGSKLEGVQIALYEKFEPALRSGVEVLSKLLDALNFVIEHSDEFIAALTGMAAGVAAYVAYTTALKIMKDGWMSLVVVQKLVTAAQAAMNVVMSLNPIGLVIAAIVALVAAFVVLWNKSEKFRNFWIGLWEVIKEKALVAWEWIKETFSKLGEFFSTIWQGIKETASELWIAVTNFFSAALNKIKEIWSIIVAFFSGIWEGIKTVFEPVVEFFKFIFELAWTSVKFIWDSAVTFFTIIWTLIKAVFEPVADWFKEKFSIAWQWIKEIWSTAIEFFSTIWQGIKVVFDIVNTWFSEKFQAAWNEIKSAFSNTTSWFSERWEDIKNIFDIVNTWFSEKFNAAWEEVKKAFEGVGDFFGGIWDTIKEKFTSVGTMVGDAIGGAFKTAINAAISTVEKTINFIPNEINPMLQTITDWTGVSLPYMPTVNLPRLAKGGIVNRKTVATIGEAGEEAVIPLERNTEGLKKIAKLIAEYMPKSDKLSLSKFIDVIKSSFEKLIDTVKNINIPELKIDLTSIIDTIKNINIPKFELAEINDNWLDDIANRLSNKTMLQTQPIQQTINNNTTNNFNQTNNSPKSLSRLEIYRQSKNLLRMKG